MGDIIEVARRKVTTARRDNNGLNSLKYKRRYTMNVRHVAGRCKYVLSEYMHIAKRNVVVHT